MKTGQGIGALVVVAGFFPGSNGYQSNYVNNNLKFNIMSTNIYDSIVKTQQKEWQPLIEKGVHYEGIFVKSLKFDPEKNRSTTILLKFEPGASYPYHNHPAGEELFIMKGEASIAGAHLEEGDYLYTPPNLKHSVKSENGCIILFIVPEEVEIL